MKSLLFIASALLITGSLSAQTYQPIQRYELDVSGGISKTSIPEESYYRGEKSKWNPAGSLQFHYNINEHFQTGLEVGATQWTTTGNNWHVIGTQGQDLGPKPVKFVFANPALTFAAEFNVMVPLTSDFRLYNFANFHFGVSAGYVATINDGGVTYTKPGIKTADSNFTYLSEYHFQPGSGFLLGVQIGYTHYITDRVGINLETTPRYVHISSNDARLGSGNDEYSLFYIPVTIGVKLRW